MEAWGPSDATALHLRRVLAQSAGPRWTVDPPLTACEAAGLEVAVRAWWRGVPGRRTPGPRPEDAWLRAAVAGGATNKSRIRLHRWGVPSFVVEGGLQLGQFLRQDCESRQTWWSCQQDEDRQAFATGPKDRQAFATGPKEDDCQSDFVARVIDQVFRRFDVRAEAWLAQEQGLGHPCLILAPHTPSAPSTPRPASSRASGRRVRRAGGPCSAASATPVPGGDAQLAGPSPRKQSEPPRKETEDQKAAASACYTSGRASVLSTRSPTVCETPLLDSPLWPLEEASTRTAPSTPTPRGAGTARFRSGRVSVPPARDFERSATPNQLEPEPKRAASAMAKMVRPSKTVPLDVTLNHPPRPRLHRSGTVRSESHTGAATTPRTCSKETRSSRPQTSMDEETQSSRPVTPLEEGRRPPRRARTSPRVGESNFDRWMSNMRRSITHQKERDERQDTVKQRVKKFEKPPLLQHGSSKAGQRIIRDVEKVADIFRDFDKDQSGTIEPHEFMPLLSKLMRQPASELDKDQVWKTWDAVDEDGSGSINFEEFQKWYCGTFNVEKVHDFRDFFNESIVPEDQRHVREVATKLGIDFVEIEKIWKEFSGIDADASGLIDYDEFKVLIQHQISRDPHHPEVPDKVVEKFWLDVDCDNSGSITFEEFAGWYMKFLRGDSSPMEKYYQMVGTGFRSAFASSIQQASLGAT